MINKNKLSIKYKDHYYCFNEYKIKDKLNK